MKIQEIGVHTILLISLCGSLGIAVVDEKNRGAFMDITQSLISGYLGYLTKEAVEKMREGE